MDGEIKRAQRQLRLLVAQRNQIKGEIEDLRQEVENLELLKSKLENSIKTSIRDFLSIQQELKDMMEIIKE